MVASEIESRRRRQIGSTVRKRERGWGRKGGPVVGRKLQLLLLQAEADAEQPLIITFNASHAARLIINMNCCTTTTTTHIFSIYCGAQPCCRYRSLSNNKPSTPATAIHCPPNLQMSDSLVTITSAQHIVIVVIKGYRIQFGGTMKENSSV